ncbi:MAG TPA: 4Fe-4S dicluster domain-containing protein, partial [Syntrophorhabdaceae bacterium]|nr:4Fe-4S dicluster domain-containing protein [Syntrophorhabdaceae bacterium]
GTISNWVGKNKNQLELKADSCTHCNVCNRACPMSLSPQIRDREGEMSFKGDCLKCELCTHVCPADALAFRG